MPRLLAAVANRHLISPALNTLSSIFTILSLSSPQLVGQHLPPCSSSCFSSVGFHAQYQHRMTLA